MAKCHDYAGLTQSLQTVQKSHPDWIRLSSLAESSEGRSVWMLEIGRGKSSELLQRPALLIVAGLEGNRLMGSEAVLAFVESLDSATECVQSILDHVALYVIPRLNPDAAERYFQNPRKEQVGNCTPFDADHDGLLDEDGMEDLDGDGQISWIRVEDPKGTWISHPNENRILVEADTGKGESGKWLYFEEGKDNDLDEKFNEDGLGEVNFNKNFPFDYTFFEPGAGVYQVCENETRALAEFVIDHPNITVSLSFSSNGSLLKTPESGDETEWGKPQTKLRKEDEKLYNFLGEQYRKQMGIADPIETPAVKGAFADWMYFHRGRLSLSTPVWTPEIALAVYPASPTITDTTNELKPDAQPNSAEIGAATKEEKPEDKKEGKQEDDKRGQIERDFLKWVEENAPDYFLPWKEFSHPDFPGQHAEIGGFIQFAKTIPPARLQEEILKKNADFITWLASKLPHVEIRDVEVKDLDKDIFDIRATIRNTGYLPTVLAHGQRTGEVLPMRVEIDIPKERILAGDPIARIGALQGSGGIEEVRWVVQSERGKSVTLRVFSALGGRVERTVELSGKGE